jgi:ribosome biogenesis GTPase
MPEGQIVRAVGGFFYVRTKDGEEIQCRARGIFKYEKKKMKPLVGDRVQFEQTGLDQGVITSIQPRKTELVRPPIANVDQAVVVCSLKEPDFHALAVDRFLVHAEKEGLDVVLCLTKRDLLEDEHEIDAIRQLYKATGYPIVVTSIRTGEGIEELKQHLKDRVSVFAGQSGVGKSSLLNELYPDLKLETGEVSRKLGRGRHTTREVQLLTLPNGGQVADTPGFSQLSFNGMEPEDVRDAFVDFLSYAEECRYRGCLHLKEPGCAVREAVENGELPDLRYQHYVHFQEIVKEEMQRRY